MEARYLTVREVPDEAQAWGDFPEAIQVAADRGEYLVMVLYDPRREIPESPAAAE